MAEDDFDFGNDLSCITDLDVDMREITGREVLSQAVARRLQTPRGGLFYDTDYGYDLRQFLSGIQLPIGQIETAIENEVLKEERVEEVNVSVRFDESNKAMIVSLSIEDAIGPFDLVLGISDVTVEILREAA